MLRFTFHQQNQQKWEQKRGVWWLFFWALISTTISASPDRTAVVHSLSCVRLFVTPWTEACQASWVRSLGWQDPLEKGMVTHSSILAGRIPWTEEPEGIPSMGVAKNRTWRGNEVSLFEIGYFVENAKFYPQLSRIKKKKKTLSTCIPHHSQKIEKFCMWNSKFLYILLIWYGCSPANHCS